MGGSRVDSSSSAPLSYKDAIYEYLPYYLSIGMSYEQYMYQDSTLVKYYRKAEELRFEKQNYMLWLQGSYVYEAIADVSPVLHAFAKSGTKIIPYRDSPYPLTESAKEQAEKQNMLKMKEQIMKWANTQNEIMKKKEEI